MSWWTAHWLLWSPQWPQACYTVKYIPKGRDLPKRVYILACRIGFGGICLLGHKGAVRMNSPCKRLSWLKAFSSFLFCFSASEVRRYIWSHGIMISPGWSMMGFFFPAARGIRCRHRSWFRILRRYSVCTGVACRWWPDGSFKTTQSFLSRSCIWKMNDHGAKESYAQVHFSHFVSRIYPCLVSS